MVGDGFKVSQYIPVAMKSMERLSSFIHMIQLWVNLPKDKKMSEPKYQTLLKKDMGTFRLDDNQGEVSIIAGSFNDVKGPASTFTDINLYNVNLKNHGKVTLKEPSNFNTGILVLKGEIKVNGNNAAKASDFIVFDNVNGDILVSVRNASLGLRRSI